MSAGSPSSDHLQQRQLAQVAEVTESAQLSPSAAMGAYATPTA
jgi:hypothetical protein